MGETAALIGLGAAGLGSGLLSSASARSNNKESIAFSRWSQLESQRYNEQMYEKQLADQERLYNSYQSPQAIAKALAQVGVNPASALTQLGGKGMPSVPSASGSSPVGTPHLENEGLALGQGIQHMAGAINSIAGAKMQDAQSKETRDMLQHKINGMLITQGLEQAQKDYQGLMNTLTEKYGDQKWSAEIQDLLSKAVLNVANGNLSDAQSDYTKVLKMISDEDLGMKQEERAVFGTRLAIGIDNLKKQGLLLDEERKTERSHQSLNYASAKNQRQQAETEYYKTSVAAIEAEQEAATKQARIDAMLAKLAADKTLSEGDREEARKRRDELRRINTAKDNQKAFRVMDDILNWAKRILSGIFSVGARV